MTEKETIQILAFIESNYAPFRNRQATLELWESAFKDVPFEEVKEVVLKIIATDPSEFAPKISKVMNLVNSGKRFGSDHKGLEVKRDENGNAYLKFCFGKAGWSQLPVSKMKPWDIIKWWYLTARDTRSLEAYDKVLQAYDNGHGEETAVAELVKAFPILHGVWQEEEDMGEQTEIKAMPEMRDSA